MTHLGGSIMEPEVAQTMADASRVMFRMQELNDRAGKLIAKYTHAEAGLVTAGAGDGMIVAAIADIPGVSAAVVQDDWVRPVPEVSIRFLNNWAGPPPDKIVDILINGDPPITIGGRKGARLWGEHLFVNPQILMGGEAELVGQRLCAIMRC